MVRALCFVVPVASRWLLALATLAAACDGNDSGDAPSSDAGRSSSAGQGGGSGAGHGGTSGSGGPSADCALLAECCAAISGAQISSCELAVEQAAPGRCALTYGLFASQCPGVKPRGTAGAGGTSPSGGAGSGGAGTGGAGTAGGGGRPSTCDNGVIDGLEIGIDCGGPCGQCDTMPCEADADCRYDVCRDGYCARGTCDDGVRNALESDVDCGSSACGPCDTGARCYELHGGIFCASHICSAGICAAPTCSDGVHNQTEGGIDCGGPCPTKCAIGDGCIGGGDCVNGSCQFNRCQFPHCVNHVKDGGETLVDCGGPECAPCPFM